MALRLIFHRVQVGHIGGGDLQGIEKDGSFFRFDAAVQHHFANIRYGRLDGNAVFEEREVGVSGRGDLVVVDVDFGRARMQAEKSSER